MMRITILHALISPALKHRNRQTLRKLKNTPMKTSKEQNSAVTEEKQILQKILSFMENSSSNSKPNKVPPLQDKTDQGHTPNAKGQVYNPKDVGKGQNQGQGRYADLQCFNCSERGHIKRNCPVLKAEREQAPQYFLLLAVPRRLFCFGSLVILDVARCYLWLYTLYINIKIGKNSC